jgi:hypothetical protein
METKHVIVLEIDVDYRFQIKSENYSCIYLTCILYYFIKLISDFLKLFPS